MVIDTSAIIAILFDEPERPVFTSLIEQATSRLISTCTALECTIVIQVRKRQPGLELLELFLKTTEIKIVSFDSQQLALA